MNTASSRIFISYSHRGNGPDWKAWLLRHLAVFERHHLLDVWQDGKIRVSSFWNDDIEQAMGSARLAVVLLTKEALESQFIRDVEFPFLRERQQRDGMPVFPVICEECDWRAHDWLRATQAPNESNPLAQLTEPAQDRILRQLATDIAAELSRVALAELSALRVPLRKTQGLEPVETAPSEIRSYLDKFPLTRGPGLREERLIGREQELALLDLAFASSFGAFGGPPSGGPGSRVNAELRTAIVSLVAWGGVGKTMLVQHWLRRLLHTGSADLRIGTNAVGSESGAPSLSQPSTLNSQLFSRVYAWSFYSQGTKEDRQASEDTFLAHALEWFGVQCEPTLSPWDKGRLLADAVARERTLLILDGIEPLQYPPGPMGGQLRAPGVQSLLKRLARRADRSEFRVPGSAFECLCLVTTREPLTDLADFQRREGSVWGSVLRVDLGNLTEEAGAALLHHAGASRAGAAEIRPDDTELLAASREVDGHALTLNLLGRFLARAHGSDIRRRDLVKFEEADRKEQGGTTFKMLAAFENWFAKSGEFGARQLAVLRILGLFDRPADVGCINALRKLPIIAGLTDPLFTTRLDANGQATSQPLVEEDWNTATSFLADFGLLFVQSTVDESERLLDCHPLIREHFATDTSVTYHDSWQSAHHRLFQYLGSSTAHQPSTIEGLLPLYYAVEHACHSRNFRDGFHMLCERILRNKSPRDVTNYSERIGAVSENLAAISSFFEKRWTEVTGDLSEQASWFKGEAGRYLRALGRLDEACQPMQQAASFAASLGDFEHASSCSFNLAETLLVVGRIQSAIAAATEAVLYANNSADKTWIIPTSCVLATALHQRGQMNEAGRNFSTAWRACPATKAGIPALFGAIGYAVSDFCLSSSERAAWFCLLKDRTGEESRNVTQFPDGRLRGGVVSRSELLQDIGEVEKREDQAVEILGMVEGWTLDIAYPHLALARCCLYREILKADPSSLEQTASSLGLWLENVRRANQADYLPPFFVVHAMMRYLRNDTDGARADLDEVWDIAERGPMRLHLADIHLHRARLFFREKVYPWKSPQADLAAAEKLINDCCYHRRDEELADAKRAILRE